MKMIKKMVCMFLAISMCTGLWGCNTKKEEEATLENVPMEGTTTVNITEEVTLNLWYTGEYMQNYLEYAVKRFEEENPGVKIALKLSATANYLENINSNSIKQTNVIDVYMLPSEKLEQAYLAGLALPYEPLDTVYTTKNYSETALHAVTYKGKRVAYPLCFDSAFLVYNHAYTDKAPATFDELLDFANNFEVEDGNEIGAQLEQVLIWNVSDVLMNYQFLSGSFQIGGEDGDDRNDITVYHANVIKGLEYYKSLSDFFAVDRKTITDEEVVEYFISGKAAFTITNTAGLTRLHTEGMDFGVCAMPDITATLPASALSTTQVLVVNPYSKNIEVSQKLVQALSFDYADDFYIKTGYFPARFNWNYDSKMVEGVYDNYADSATKAKIMNLGDLYVRLEILLHNIWDDGNTEELLMEFQQFVKEQLKE